MACSHTDRGVGTVHGVKRLGFNAIKESFDRLPTAACFFDRTGNIVLCNQRMYQLSRYLLDSDMQYLGEVEEALSALPKDIVRVADVENTYRFPNKTVWRFEKTEVKDRYGEIYIQLTAADVTELQRALTELTDDSRKLEKDAEKLKRLSANVGALAREKELLAAKSAMHDGLAACITLTKQYITGDLEGISASAVCNEWEKVITFRDSIRLSEKKKLLDSSRTSGVTVRIRGEEPTDGGAELMYTAMQVCLNNAIQYAKATELYVNIWESEGGYTVMIRNNGKPPEKKITEGGGLTNLRHRIENSGGRMTVQSLPEFSLVIEIPKFESPEGYDLWL